MRDGDGLRVGGRGGAVARVWSRAVSGIEIKKAVLREINEVNASLICSRVWASYDEVWIEACMPVEILRPLDVGFMVAEVGHTADRLGSMLAAIHGGRVAHPDAAEHEWEDEER